MRALDCEDPANHPDVHFTGADDDDLVRQVAEHIRQAHADMSPDQARQIVTEGSYDE